MPTLSPRLVLTAALLALIAAPAAPAQSPSNLSEILVEVTRGPLVESRHYGRLVAVDPDGDIRWSLGDPHELIFPRSSLKPLQALATVIVAQELAIDIPPDELAIICASHEGHDYHVQAVKLLLARADADEGDLHCGPNQGSRLRANCSGKHAGMLLHAKLSGDSPVAYWQPDHPIQQRIQTAIGEFTGHDQPLQWGIDGCGVPNYALPLYRLGLGYARLANPETAPEKYRAAAAAIRAAMQAHPELISRRDSFDARLMDSAAGRLLGKTGAEACYGMGLSDPALGIAVKIEDGEPRGMPCVLLQALERVGALTPEIERAVGDQRMIAVQNTIGESVGQIRAADWSAAPHSAVGASGK